MKELAVIATPIGCLGDITVRARESLTEAGAVICENIPRGRKLLSALGIKGKFLAAYPADGESRAENIFERLASYDKCAFVTSAGTPSVSDPGHFLMRAAYGRGVKVFPVPGPSAPASLLSVCPEKVKDFIFAGFLPKKKEALKKKLAGYFKLGLPVVVFTTKRDIRKVSGVLKEEFPAFAVFAGREMTKKFEEYVYFEDAAGFSAWSENIKGEITLIVFPEKEKVKNGVKR